jgi:(E)-4-hydroxy-3-methylbut-2-enyl-diphosphate synthase
MGLNVVSCPTCGRTRIDLISLAAQFEEAAKREGLTELPLRVALMGCAVNGPGEAREADIGICGGDGEGLLIAKGEILRKVPESELIPTLIGELKKRKEMMS